ncbi:cryptochrome/photolyase family protein [Ulvibacterium marinum]|uniref:cryptochrome/photolyase family protein n=1 Tax=Ulvibacterium marinum TaxID=2419782 RepID=UPI0024951259|nr:cryptochrome/photolyase family protein [Ulvibacterium marinum]
MNVLRFILGDQLNLNHSWFKEVDDSTTYLMAEMRQETDYVKHHIQKVVAFFIAMRNFAETLEKKGHRIIYLKITDPENPQNLEKLISLYVEKTGVKKFEYQLPDEYRLDRQLQSICQVLEVDTEAFDTEHFYTKRHELKEFFEGKKQLVMESFYRMMRKKHDILMANGQPEGGKWNFDQSNRKKWTGTPEIPQEKIFNTDISAVIKQIRSSGVETFGNLDEARFHWPTSRIDSISLLNYFCEHLLKYFGDYQDALHTDKKFLFHSRLSFVMNSKMLSPKEVVNQVLEYYYNHSDEINISQVEGFIRQIIGWREYMRGIYWKEMPGYANYNKLENYNKLPSFYWTGHTKMNCLKHAIGQSLDTAYAHHIQRLMITGNFALLTQTHPDEVDQWYLGIYIDALEWVEITNTRGMSQFADGGIVATKPYVSSANYINKMSNYCTDCHYSPKQKTGEKGCPFNSLYWNFLDEKKKYFKNNPRMRMMLNLLEKKSIQEITSLKQRAKDIIENPEKY